MKLIVATFLASMLAFLAGVVALFFKGLRWTR